jgi:predicted transglutaminase-like cysteine proteinase
MPRRRKKIEAVNDYMNKVAFVPDSKNYGEKDHWATPMEFLARGGDCEDYAVAKYVSLRALGIPKDKMRIAIVNDEVMRMPHAVLIVYDRGQAMVLG